MEQDANKQEQGKLKFLSTELILLWTLVLIVIPIAIFSTINESTTPDNVLMILLISTCIVLIMLFASILLFRKLGERDHKANYIISINIAIAIYHIISIMGIFFDRFFGVPDKVFTFIQPIIVLVGAIVAIRYYKLNLNLSGKFIEPGKVFLSISIGILFGLLFWTLKEPIVYLFSNTVLVFVAYTLLIGISEEILFRFIIFRLAEKAFAYKIAIWLQAVVFAGMHFISLKYILEYYKFTATFFAETFYVSAILYFIALVMFGYVCGKLVGVRKTESFWENGNIIYAIIVHWITNFITLFLFFM